MSGSRLGRGRGGRLAVYGVCGAVVLLMVFLYRAATSEMARLRDLHEQCAHQQEALAAQLQVIFEYKVRLEKSLAEEKSSNAAVKQELQQRATREKSLRDKDSVEAMQRFNSLQQTYKILQTEHQDLQEECKKREKQALEETNRLETTLQDLRGRLRQAGEEKASAVETLKTKYRELDMEKIKLEDKYNELLDTNGNAGSTIEHLKKETSQLRHELDNLKKTCVRSTSPSLITVSPRATASQLALQKSDSKPIPAPQQQQQQQVSSPLHAPRNYRADGRAAGSEEKTLNDDANEPANDIRFVQRNGNIVPAGPSELKEAIGDQRDPSDNDFQQKQKDVVERPNVSSVAFATEEKNRLDEEQNKQVMSPPLNRDDDGPRNDNIPAAVPGSQAEQPLAQPAVERTSTVASSRPNAAKVRTEDDELQALQDRVDGILNHNVSAPHDFASSRKAENSTVANNVHLVSPSVIDKPAPLPPRPLSKIKLPVGVLPIPEIILQKDNAYEEKRQEEIRKRDDAVAHNLQPPPPKIAPPANVADIKEKNEPLVEAGNLDPPFAANPPAVRHVGEQIIERRANEGWFRVGPGVQEVGEELNQLGRVPGLDDGQGNGGDDQYDGGDYDKEPQQKNDIRLAEGEDEGEDEGDMLEYPHNLKQEKRE